MKYEAETNTIKLPAGELCLLALRGGDLDLRPGARGIGLRRAAEGQEAHQLLQKRMSENGYEIEKTLVWIVETGDFKVEISGRADGVLHGDIPVVEEIKTTNGRVDRPPTALHEAQAMCYAWMLAQKEHASAVEVRMTKYRPSDEACETTTVTKTAEELEDYCAELISRVLWRAGYIAERARTRLPSAKGCRFPYRNLREGQETLLGECYRDIRHGKRLFVEAPTGIGKTVSTLYPAVRALGEGSCDRVL